MWNKITVRTVRVIDILLLLINLISFAYGALDCFDCADLMSLDECHTIKTCLDSQMCYTETYYKNGEVLFAMGCREKLFCSGIDMTPFFGRRRAPAPGCNQCCGLHGCNKYLCPVRFTTPPPAVDGQWSTWSSWDACEPLCGVGIHFRYRQCNNPPPSAHGRLCMGDTKDVALCHNSPCPDPPLTPKTTTDIPQTTTTSATTTTSTTTPKTSSVSPSTPKQATTTGHCVDLTDCSAYYRPEACVGVYSAWAHKYCPVHCGFCPTSPIPCVDEIDNCHEYEADICTTVSFWQWREKHCRKFCQLC